MASWYDAPMDALSGWQDKLNTFLEPQEMTPEEYREWLKKKRYNFMYNVYKETTPPLTFTEDSWGDAYAAMGSYPGDPGHGTDNQRVPKPGIGAKPADTYFKEMDRMFLSSMLGSAFGGKKKQVTGAPPPSKNQPKPGAFKLVAPSPIPKKKNPYEWTL